MYSIASLFTCISTIDAEISGRILVNPFIVLTQTPVQKQPSCEEGGEESLKSLIPMKPLFGGANNSETQEATLGKDYGKLGFTKLGHS